MEIGTKVKVRLHNYKSFRHYGGREITTTSEIFDATYVRSQDGHQPHIVKLVGKCFGFPDGHIIAITVKDFNP